MKTLTFFLAISAVAWAQDARPIVTNAQLETRPYSGDLAAQIRATSATWFGYAIRTIRSDRSLCGWRLEDGYPDTGSRTSSLATPVHLEGSAAAAVLFRVESNKVEKIEIYSTDCPLDAGGLPFVWMTDVPAKTSLAYLQTLVSANGAEHTAEAAMLAISMHEDAQADDILEELARPAAAQSIREKAIFWLGANRGARGVAALKNILATDASEQIRAKVVFALSISKQPDALDPIIHAANNDSSPHVRSQALFWLAQKAGDPRRDNHYRRHRERPRYRGEEESGFRAFAASQGPGGSEADRGRAQPAEPASPQTGLLLAGPVGRSARAGVYRADAPAIR